MYDTGWENIRYDYKVWAGRASGFGWADGSGGTNADKPIGYGRASGFGWADGSGGTNADKPIGYGRARREYGRHGFGKSEGYGFGYGDNYGSGKESNTGTGAGAWETRITKGLRMVPGAARATAQATGHSPHPSRQVRAYAEFAIMPP